MGSIRSVFVKVNSNPRFRAKLLKDPVGTLKKEGYKLTSKNQKELKRLFRLLKKHLPELGELPAGYEALLDDVEGKHSSRKTGDPGPLII